MAKNRLLDIKEKKNIAILRKSGYPFREIAAMTGFSLGAVQNAIRAFDDEMKISESVEKLNEAEEYKARKDLKEFVPADRVAAIKVHRKAMRDYEKDKKTALAAAEKTLDRIEGKPIQRNINENVNVEISSDKISKLLNDKGYMRVLDNI